MGGKVEDWVREVTRLADFARSKPQASYAAFTFWLRHRWTYFMRILPDIDTLLQPSKSTLVYKILIDDTAPNLRRNVDQTDYHFRNIATDLTLPKPRIEFLKISFNYSGAMLRLKLTYIVCQDWTGQET